MEQRRAKVRQPMNTELGCMPKKETGTSSQFTI
jgi:hypothetical protein